MSNKRKMSQLFCTYQIFSLSEWDLGRLQGCLADCSYVCFTDRVGYLRWKEDRLEWWKILSCALELTTNLHQICKTTGGQNLIDFHTKDTKTCWLHHWAIHYTNLFTGSFCLFEAARCHAIREGKLIQFFHQGACGLNCPEHAPCNDDYAPVCASQNTTFCRFDLNMTLYACL